MNLQILRVMIKTTSYRKLALFLSFISLAVSACYADDASLGLKKYSAHGVVEHISPDFRTVTIHHQAIPNYMMEMTMDFNVKNTNELSGISPKDEVTFTLVVGENDEWVENIRRVGHSIETNGMSMPMKMSGSMQMYELKPGDQLPDYELTSEDGTQVHISDFRGKAVAFTFFFTRCPLPDYCPRMNNNFKEARNILLTDAHASTNWQFLSISFDPGFDTPEVLSEYARYYRGDDPDRWLFTSAPTNVLAEAGSELDLMIMRAGSNISHNLRTVVLDTQGKIFCQFDNNQWTPSQLGEAMTQASQTNPNH
jgi:protein SCO1